MPRPPLPGSVWIHSRIKLTEEEMDAFKAIATKERKTDAAMVTSAVRAAISKISPEVMRAYRALRGPSGHKHKAKSNGKAPPPPRRKKHAKK